jgi:putative ABC transport system permease protein
MTGGRMGARVLLDALRQDARYAVRTLRRAPGFALVVVTTLAVGIGATTAVFSVVNGVLLRDLPYRDSDRLVRVLERSEDGAQRPPSYLTFRDWQSQAPSLGGAIAGMAFAKGEVVRLAGESGPEPVLVAFVAPGFFAAMDARPARGRFFSDEEQHARSGPVAVLSHGVWQRRFGGDPAIVGKRIHLNGAATTIIGVMPPDGYPEWASLWQPIGLIETTDASLHRRGARADTRAVIRIASGADSARAAAALATIERRLAAQYPEVSRGWTAVSFTPLRDEILGNVRASLLTLTGAVVLVLLLTCANVANLFAVRAAGRARELAVRSAVGAGRARVAAQLLTESLVLGLSGGLLGCLLAVAFVRLVRHVAVTRLPRLDQIEVDGLALLVALAVSVLAALVVGTGPALRAPRANLVDRLRAGTLGAVGGSGERRVRSTLVVAQIALALVLLVGAGLLVQSFRRVQQVPIGFDPENLIAIRIAPPDAARDDPAGAVAFYDRLLAAARAVPGVGSAALVNHVPVGGGYVPTPVQVEGAAVGGTTADEALYRTAGASYLGTMRMRLLRGRWLSDEDVRSRATHFVVNETMARRFWPNQDPVGRRATLRRAAQGRPDFGAPLPGVIVGVVADVRQFGQEADVAPEVYVPYTVEVWPSITVVTRVSRPERVIPALRRAVLEVDPNIVVAAEGPNSFRAATTMISSNVGQRRFATSLLGAFSVVAFVLAVLGLYAVVAYGVAQRTREIGIRVAIGATARDVVRLVVGEGAKLTALGVAVGTAGAVVAARFIRTMLFQTTVADPLPYLGVVALLGGAALVAAYLPARRAARTDPTIAMRVD